MSRAFSARIGLCGGLVLLSLASLSGCGGRSGYVSGKVTHQGKPVTSGAVIFHGADGRSDSGNIDAEGKYVVAQAPVGVVKVTVDTGPARPVTPPKIVGPKRDDPAKHPGEKAEGNSGKGPPRKAIVVPEKYKDPDQSGLSFKVTGGKQTYDVKLD